MKAIILISALLVSTTSWAQPDHCYWVVETRPTVHSSIVRFYNAENLLLEELTITHKKISISRSKDKRYLNRRLREAERKFTVATAKK